MKVDPATGGSNGSAVMGRPAAVTLGPPQCDSTTLTRDQTRGGHASAGGDEHMLDIRHLIH
jgi:hypothetical protein